MSVAVAKELSRFTPVQRSVISAAISMYDGLTTKNSPFKKVSQDPAERLRNLIDTAEPELASVFAAIIQQLKNERTLDELALLIEQGRIQEALESAARAGARFAAAVNGVHIVAGGSTADFIQNEINVIIGFDSTNARAVRVMQGNNLRFVREFAVEQTIATQSALRDGLQRGLNPREQARAFRDSIGLTSRQLQAVQRYREALERGSLEALTRELRDRRFDRTVRRAARTGVPLTRAQIDKMVTRYQERFVRFRSEVIARTEALRTVHEANEEMYQQAFDSGVLNPNEVVRTWVTAQDARVRDSHGSMNGQERPVGEAFVSGNGNLLNFPGDPSAPASEIIQCRCVVTTRIP